MRDRVHIIITEDSDATRQILQQIFEVHTDYALSFASNGDEAIEMANRIHPDLMLLDIMMPHKDGFEVAAAIKQNTELEDTPIIFLTAIDDKNFTVRAFELGGVDYVTKPVNTSVLLARVKVHIGMKRMRDELREKNRMLLDHEYHLSQLVDQKTKEIEQTTLAMVSALENANHFNDPDTGNHLRRVSEYSGLLADKYGCDTQFVRRIKLYSSLHDVGKVGVSEMILKKPGKLTKEEYQLMQQHVVVGYQMLGASGIDPMAPAIALYHHEKWDGTGYASGKKGFDIPLEARIVTLADVYDALSFSRVYKEAFSEEKTSLLIHEAQGQHFEPRLVDILYQNLDQFVEIKNRLR